MMPNAALCGGESKTDSAAAIRAAFETWWRKEGTPIKYEKHIAEMAWLKGAEIALQVTK